MTQVRYLAALVGICLSTVLSAQSWDGYNAGKAILFNFSYGPQLPLEDLKVRFGHNFSPELSVDYMTPNNWTMGVQGQFLFGSQVKEDVLQALRTESGEIIGNDRAPADIQLRQRGAYYGLRVGRLFGVNPKNERSGIRVNVGAGLLQHRIRIQRDPTRGVPQLTGDYAKGYDRLSNGLAFYQFLGYQHIGNNNSMHLTAGFELIEGLTQSRRSINFDTQTQDTAQRLDVLAGFRVTFTMPLYLGNADEVFY